MNPEEYKSSPTGGVLTLFSGTAESEEKVEKRERSYEITPKENKTKAKLRKKKKKIRENRKQSCGNRKKKSRGKK